jgi:hypothetical protein
MAGVELELSSEKLSENITFDVWKSYYQKKALFYGIEPAPEKLALLCEPGIRGRSIFFFFL